ncbi:MAG: beta galactosidase jelly roll domain-containing protein [Melioribacteraceae bacterium]|nr:beta galactosidase jelly roll domain-containing protein [Melioribacteraceae bacterium]
MKSFLSNKLSRKSLLLFLIFLLCFSVKAESPDNSDWDRVVNLKGRWKFAIGDYKEWASKDFYDEEWETIRVPSTWEDEGFYDYDGYAWYRTEFQIDAIYEGENLYLDLGYIDDVDEVYINGELIGFSGVFPPNYTTAYNARRVYTIPDRVLNFSSANTIAVRVYDSQLAGGIVYGDIGIFREINKVHPEIQLAGSWKFNIGDEMIWKEPDYDHSEWGNIMVPGFWMHYGFQDYDGYAWYRKEFYFDQNQSGKFVLVMGKIDDIDEVYLNGKLVGSTGDMENEQFEWDDYNKLRVYYLDESDLTPNSKNLIAVRVLDVTQHGGIYEGPVGIMKLKTFQEFWKEREKSQKRKKGFWEMFFK